LRAIGAQSKIEDNEKKEKGEGVTIVSTRRAFRRGKGDRTALHTDHATIYRFFRRKKKQKGLGEDGDFWHCQSSKRRSRKRSEKGTKKERTGASKTLLISCCESARLGGREEKGIPPLVVRPSSLLLKRKKGNGEVCCAG